MAKRNKPKPVIISPQAIEDITNILSHQQIGIKRSLMNFFKNYMSSIISFPSIQKYLDTTTRVGIFVNMHLPNKILFITETGGQQ